MTIENYLEQLSEERREAINSLRKVINENLPAGFEEGIQYNMIGYYVPHSIYPQGYHCDPKQPLPFASIASQKNTVNLYHMGLYMRKDLMDWYLAEYPKYIKTKPDMGKSCLRYKDIKNLPLELIAQLMRQMTVEDYIKLYEENYRTSTR